MEWTGYKLPYVYANEWNMWMLNVIENNYRKKDKIPKIQIADNIFVGLENKQWQKKTF